MEIGRPDCRSRRMEFWKLRECFVVVMIVEMAPWDANILAMSMRGIWWPPPTKGKKNISTGDDSEESMDTEEEEETEIGLLCMYVYSSKDQMGFWILEDGT